jgi:hypothetical protein
MQEVIVRSIDDAKVLFSVEDGQALAKIVYIADFLILETDVARSYERGGQRRKLCVRGGN